CDGSRFRRAGGGAAQVTRLIVICCLLLAHATFAAVTFNIPRVEKIKVDGDQTDWREEGLRVDFLTSTGGRQFDAKDFRAKARIGWDDDGLLVFVHVTDDVIDANMGTGPVGRNDSV